MAANIKVAVRVRPFTSNELDGGYHNSYVKVDKKKKQVRVEQPQDLEPAQADRTYSFDCVLAEKSTQQDVYKGCGIDYLVSKVLEGYHSTILVYGQTGSGKTFTMQGHNITEVGDGIVPRVVESLFGKIQNSPSKVVSVSVSYLQIYSQRIYDLLNPGSFNPKIANSGNSLRLRWNKDEQFTVENLFVYECQDSQELLQHVRVGLSNRVNGSHRLNISSSRSHTILTIRVKCFEKEDPSFVYSSRIELVDLAGSERTALTGSEGRLAKQSIDINKSLFTLRQVISVLSEQQKTHIPYRQSKLTSLLKQSIGGNSYCLMIACVSPNDLFMEENISTLTYATKASMIQNEPMQNKDPHRKEIEQLQAKIRQLNTELQKAQRNNQISQKIQKQKPESHKAQIETARLNNTKKVHFDSLLIKAQALLNKVQTNQNRAGDGPVFKGGSYWQMLLQSVSMVRDLLKSNRDLRQQVQHYKKLIQKKDLQIHQLFRENEHLKNGSQQYYPYQTNLNMFKKASRVHSRIQHHRTEHSPDQQVFVPIIAALAKQRRVNTQSNKFNDTQELKGHSKQFNTTSVLLKDRREFAQSFHDMSKLQAIANRTRTKSSNDKYLETPIKKGFESSPFRSYNRATK